MFKTKLICLLPSPARPPVLQIVRDSESNLNYNQRWSWKIWFASGGRPRITMKRFSCKGKEDSWKEPRIRGSVRVPGRRRPWWRGRGSFQEEQATENTPRLNAPRGPGPKTPPPQAGSWHTARGDSSLWVTTLILLGSKVCWGWLLWIKVFLKSQAVSQLPSGWSQAGLQECHNSLCPLSSTPGFHLDPPGSNPLLIRFSFFLILLPSLFISIKSSYQSLFFRCRER